MDFFKNISELSFYYKILSCTEADSLQLSEKYKAKPTDHGTLSDALWAWVIDLSASASANDKQGYDMVKQQIKSLTGAESVSKALETGFWRTAGSNDYPAWALAKVRLAAATMLDKELYHDIDNALIFSIESSKKAGAKAEYVLAVIDSQLANTNWKRVTSGSKTKTE